MEESPSVGLLTRELPSQQGDRTPTGAFGARPEEGKAPWLLLEGSPRGVQLARLESIGCHLPDRRVTTREFMATTRHHTRIDLERLTGIHERRMVSDGEDSFTLAMGAARDCLARSRYDASDLDVLINCSITKFKGGPVQHLEPSFALSLKTELGARRALAFDISNACAGMLTGVFLLNHLVRRGVVRRGMVVSGEYISPVAHNAAAKVRSLMSSQLASLTLGDAGAAAIVDRASDSGGFISAAGFTTLSEHSRLCVAYPTKVGPGASMYTKARAIHQMAIEDAPPLLKEAFEAAGLSINEIDYVIPHQTSARAIRKGMEAWAPDLGGYPRNPVVVTVDQFGNTASTTHFVALSRYLKEGRFTPTDKVALLALASGLEIGILVFEVGDLVRGYGNGS